MSRIASTPTEFFDVPEPAGPPVPSPGLGTFDRRDDVEGGRFVALSLMLEHRDRALRLIGSKLDVPFRTAAKPTEQDLFALALKARERAVVPMSGFRVGAAAVTKSGRVLTAANMEISDRVGIGTCAECSIAFQLAGDALETLVLVSDASDPIAPCGACRQTLFEMAPGEARILMTSSNGKVLRTTVAELMPSPTETVSPEALEPYQGAIVAALDGIVRSDISKSKIEPRGAALLDTDGAIHVGCTRKGRCTLANAVENAVNAKVMSGSRADARALVLAGRSDGDFPTPTGRDRQELFNLGPDTPVILYNADTKNAALTTARALLPFAYRR